MIYATGAAELRRLATSCRTASGRQVCDDIAGAMRRGRGQIRSAVEVSVLSKLPKRGGLNAWVAESSFSMTTRAGSSSSVTTVRVSKAGHDLQGLDGGLVIHPGNRYGSGWYHEAVVPNTISDPIVDEGGNQLEVAIHSAAERLAERIVR